MYRMQCLLTLFNQSCMKFHTHALFAGLAFIGRSLPWIDSYLDAVLTGLSSPGDVLLGLTVTRMFPGFSSTWIDS